jgi:hypothetical protein
LFKDEFGEILTGRDELAIGEDRYVCIDVAVIETLPHFTAQNVIQQS